MTKKKRSPERARAVSDQKEKVEKLIPGWGTQIMPRFMAEYIARKENNEERLSTEVSDLQFKIECEATISRTKIEKLDAEIEAAFKAGYSTGWELGRGHGTEFYPDEAFYEWESEERSDV